AATGLFQIIGHLDLIKIYGHRPRRPVLELAEPALKVIAASGAAMEINTAGLFKPVGEIYPSRELLEQAFNLNIPVTIGSDAHAAGEVARERARARELLRLVGYTSLATFYRQEMATENIG
ncbi:MAG: histidinol phosphate phosphatase, partial [Moorella sp. (in: Bacteria)]|nr:histidinol phosphate phosphatase [Moorella sp. (in: firmicutes)]